MGIISIPARKFTDGELINMNTRVPEQLKIELEKAAKERGWTLTMLITVVLDQFLQNEPDKAP